MATDRPINVRENEEKNYFKCAKDSVFGPNAFLSGFQYREIQDLLNRTIRQESQTFLRWDNDAPLRFRQLPLSHTSSFNPRLQKYLRLTDAGVTELQRVLEEHYITMQTPDEQFGFQEPPTANR